MKIIQIDQDKWKTEKNRKTKPNSQRDVPFKNELKDE